LWRLEATTEPDLYQPDDTGEETNGEPYGIITLASSSNPRMLQKKQSPQGKEPQGEDR